jgi:hypothetical protein
MKLTFDSPLCQVLFPHDHLRLDGGVLPQRPCKTTSILPNHIFSHPAPTRLDFVMGSAVSSPSSTPSRLLQSPALCPPKKASDGSEDKENTPPKPTALPSLMTSFKVAYFTGKTNGGPLVQPGCCQRYVLLNILNIYPDHIPL